MGATCIIAVDTLPERLEMARRLGADVTINVKEQDARRGHHGPDKRPTGRRPQIRDVPHTRIAARQEERPGRLFGDAGR